MTTVITINMITIVAIANEGNDDYIDDGDGDYEGGEEGWGGNCSWLV